MTETDWKYLHVRLPRALLEKYDDFWKQGYSSRTHALIEAIRKQMQEASA